MADYRKLFDNKKSSEAKKLIELSLKYRRFLDFIIWYKKQKFDDWDTTPLGIVKIFLEEYDDMIEVVESEWCEHEVGMTYKCGGCGEDLIMDGFSYCPDCGSEIDWSD